MTKIRSCVCVFGDFGAFVLWGLLRKWHKKKQAFSPEKTCLNNKTKNTRLVVSSFTVFY
ncbi:MAG TPA: hypothetical protein VK152_10280 [Paludibacter sp.]|nr:hypothetical protein [Paludibacter sp.]